MFFNKVIKANEFTKKRKKSEKMPANIYIEKVWFLSGYSDKIMFSVKRRRI